MHYKCSIFCSFFCAGKYIDRYLENMLDQPLFDQVQFVFLDCNSPDEEYKKINEVRSKYNNVVYKKLEEDPGLYAGWNEAIKLCSSPIIGNWNADDRKNKDGLEILLKQFEKDENLDLVYGFTYVSRTANEKYEDNAFNEVYPYLPHSFQNLLMNNSPHCMPLWKKSLHNRFGYFDTSYKTASDGDMWLKICVGGAKIKLVNHSVGLYYENPTGRSTNPETLKEMIDEVNRMRSKYLVYV